jgi:two-component system phosphate regulon sensor histidine kinase PhoR
MRSVRRGWGAVFTVLLVGFLGVVSAQLLITERLHRADHRSAERLGRVRDANLAVLQHMTDAETGVRGYQLTREPLFLAPYRSGRAGVAAAFDSAGAGLRDDDSRRLLAASRTAAMRWLDEYAGPVVAGRPDPGAARGKELFDAFRAAGAAVDAAVRDEQVAAAAESARRHRAVQLVFAGAAVLFVAVAVVAGVVRQRRLLAPLEHIRRTLQRLSAGDRGARAPSTGPAEMRAVIATLNDMAARAEQAYAEDRSRGVRNEVRHAVGAVLRNNPPGAAAAARVVEIVGRALGADAAYGRAAERSGEPADVCWPPHAGPLPPGAAEAVLAAPAGAVQAVPGVAGAVAVAIRGDADHPPGLLCAVRTHGPDWSADDLRLLAAVARDIQYAADQQLLQYRQSRLIAELRALDERKDAFVATVTHELRTPLTGILGYTEMLADGDCGDLTARQERGVAAILRNARRLEATIGDLQLLDRGRSGDVVHTPVDLAALMAGTCAELAPVAEARSVTVTGGAGGPAWVCGDGGQLAHVLHNVVENAIKFSLPGGRVTWALAGGDGTVVLTVTDTGIGIAEDELPLLFTPFHRAANARDQAVQGTGLGLAIVRTIVTEHGGTVHLRSRLGAGTTCTVTLPAGAEPAGPRPAAPAEAPTSG